MRITVVDAFTDRPFAGNPAAICVLSGPADEGWMQLVAREMNLSETAFVHPEGDGFRLRWFTPATEVDLCGHATLATAHLLWEGGHLAKNHAARFQTRSGVLTATLRELWIEMDFPSEPIVPTEPPADLAGMLGGVVPRFVGRNRMDLLVELESEDAVRALRPDFGLIAATPVRGLIATGQTDGSPFDFVSRFFAPRVGVPEDPVCGSVHCALTPFWSERLRKKDLLAFQASARGGTIRLRDEGPRVVIAGRAVTTLRSELVVAP